jgi:hypothetical protein
MGEEMCILCPDSSVLLTIQHEMHDIFHSTWLLADLTHPFVPCNLPIPLLLNVQLMAATLQCLREELRCLPPACAAAAYSTVLVPHATGAPKPGSRAALAALLVVEVAGARDGGTGFGVGVCAGAPAWVVGQLLGIVFTAGLGVEIKGTDTTAKPDSRHTQGGRRLEAG